MNANHACRSLRRLLPAAILVGAPWLGGCSHSISLPGLDAPRVALSGAEGRRVAVVLSGLPEPLDVSAAGHTFHLTDFREVYARAVYTALEDSVDSVRFFSGPPGPGYDLYVEPRVTGSLASGAFAPTCTVSHEVVVKDARGAQIGAGAARFSIAGAAPMSCVSALVLAVVPSLKAALDRSGAARADAPPSFLTAALPSTLRHRGNR